MSAPMHGRYAALRHLRITLLCLAGLAWQADAQIPLQTSQDIGAVAAPGYFAEVAGVTTVGGSGADIWRTADEFHYAYAPLVGDGEIVARVLSLSNTDPWAKAGPMIRESLTAGSRFAMMIVTPGANGAAFQYRTSTNGSAAPSNSGDQVTTIPRWLRLVRQGNVVSGFISADGQNWTLRGSITLAMPSAVYVGLAVTSHNDGVVGEARFDGVAITGPAPDVQPPSIPLGVSAIGSGSSRVQLQWSASSDMGGSGVTGYRVYRDWATAPVATVTGTSFTDAGLTAATTYSYEVSAVDAAGNESGRSGPVVATTGMEPPPGAAPDWLWSIAPGTWSVISLNTMDNVNSARDTTLNPRFPSNAPWHGTGGLRAVIDAWNGGALATGFGSHGALLTYGGGRNNYLGSDVYAFDLGLQAWTRVTNPFPGPFTWPFPSTAYPDGSPLPPHTYDYVDYHPPTNSFVLLRGVAHAGSLPTNDTSAPVAHFLNLTTRTWRTGARNSATRQRSGGTSCYDNARDLFWAISPGERVFSSFDPTTENPDGTFGRYTNYPTPAVNIDGVAACDPDDDIYVTTSFRYSPQRVLAIDLKNPGGGQVVLREGGTPPPVKEHQSGWEWSKRRGAFIYWRRGGDVYEFRLVGGDWRTGTWQWSKLTGPDNTVAPQAMITDNGIYSRFQIARWGNEEVAIVVNRFNGPVYAFRIP